jgi:hypothetical protein
MAGHRVPVVRARLSARHHCCATERCWRVWLMWHNRMEKRLDSGQTRASPIRFKTTGPPDCSDEPATGPPVGDRQCRSAAGFTWKVDRSSSPQSAVRNTDCFQPANQHQHIGPLDKRPTP